MHRFEPVLPTVFTRADATAAGLSRHQIEHRIGRQWQPLRRGVYCLGSTWQAASPSGRHLLGAAAATRTHPCDETLTVSHLSAALAWGLPCPTRVTWPVCLTAQPGRRHSEADRFTPSRGRTGQAGTWATPAAAPAAALRAPVRVQVATMRARDRRRLRGAWVTSPARTAADCLRHCEPEVSVPIADAVLFRGLASTAELDDALADQDSWPFAARARRARRVVTARESWLESSSAVAFAATGLDLPSSQVEVYDRSGAFVARVDFAWVRDGVVGEADGLSKYGLSWTSDATAATDRTHTLGETLRETLLAERRRAERLADLGLRVVRWTAADLRRPDRLVARITQARQSWDGARFVGTFRLAVPGPSPQPGSAGPGSAGGHPELPYLWDTPSAGPERPQDPAPDR